MANDSVVSDVEHMLTTVDNPFNPFTQFDQWFAYDSLLGHNTSAFLARIVVTSDELSEADQSAAIEHAIDEIVRVDAMGIYIKIKKPEGSS